VGNKRIECLGSYIVLLRFNSAIVNDSNIVSSKCLQKETHKAKFPLLPGVLLRF
jgi:hypothetical protein